MKTFGILFAFIAVILGISANSIQVTSLGNGNSAYGGGGYGDGGYGDGGYGGDQSDSCEDGGETV